MFGPNRGENIRVHVTVQHKFDAAPCQLIVAPHHHVFFQLEAGNAIGQQPTRPVIPVINRDLHTRTPQHVRRRQTTRPGPDYANPFRAFQ